MIWRLWLAALGLALLGLAAPLPATAASWCGGVTSNGCACGKWNIYPCCDNGGNCTWYAWHSMCCHWGFGPGNWGNANTWAGNGSKHPDVAWLSYPVPNSIATRDIGQYGHVAYVLQVSGNNILVEEENCCDGCAGGVRTKWYKASYYNSGFLIHKKFLGPVCGNGKCESGEHCANCPSDCGSCCGNGACDNGESCSSCSKDCKCLPTGSLDSATCSAVQGWASDPDNPGAKLSVEVKCNGQTQGNVTASGAYPGHEGQGFSWKVPESLKNGQVCTATAAVKDSNSAAVTALGPKAFVCDNSTNALGIWQMSRLDAAGMSPSLPPGALQGLQYALPSAYPYPMSGQLLGCTQPGQEPFSELRGQISWDLKSQLHRVDLSVDGQVRQQWQGNAASDQELHVSQEGEKLCLESNALAQVPASTAQFFALRELQWRTSGDLASGLGRWWNAYSMDAAGLLVGHPSGDAVRVGLRSGATVVQGAGRAWLDLPQAFDGIRFILSLPPQGSLQASVEVGDQTVPAVPGAHELRGLAGQKLLLQIAAPGPLSSGQAGQFQDIRVFRNGHRTAGPWKVSDRDAWGLNAQVPSDAVSSGPAEQVGLALYLGRQSMGWWTTGAVTASLTLSGAPFERIRARLHSPALPPGTSALLAGRLRIASDEQPILDLPIAASSAQELEVDGRGQRLDLTFGLLQDHGDDGAELGVRIDALQLLRRGWWTAPSPDAAGLRDDRVPGGVVLETARPWGMAGQPLQGFARVQRSFDQPQTGVRFRYRQELDGAAVRVLVLTDGMPVAVLDDLGVQDRQIELQSPGFRHLALVLAPKASGLVVPHRWWAEFTALQTRGGGGSWQALSDAPLAVPAKPLIKLQPIASGGVTTAPSAGQPSAEPVAPGPASGGCQSGSLPAAPGGAGLLLIALALLGLARQRGRVATAKRPAAGSQSLPEGE
jgi:surface antigen